jgi:hypothetical protein
MGLSRHERELLGIWRDFVFKQVNMRIRSRRFFPARTAPELERGERRPPQEEAAGVRPLLSTRECSATAIDFCDEHVFKLFLEEGARS